MRQVRAQEPPALATWPVRLPNDAFSRLPSGTPLVQSARRDRQEQAA